MRGMTGLAVLAGALSVTGSAAADAGREGRPAPAALEEIAVSTDFKEAALRVDGFDCRPSLLASATPFQACKMHLVGVSTLTGTLEGEADLDYLAWPDPPKLRYTGVVPFRGTVAGCGEGTFVMEFSEGVVHHDQPRAEDQSYPGHNKWVVRKGSGTGDLERLAGGGDVEFRVYPLRGHDGADEFAIGTFDGMVICERAGSASSAGATQRPAPRDGADAEGTR